MGPVFVTLTFYLEKIKQPHSLIDNWMLYSRSSLSSSLKRLNFPILFTRARLYFLCVCVFHINGSLCVCMCNCVWGMWVYYDGWNPIYTFIFIGIVSSLILIINPNDQITTLRQFCVCVYVCALVNLLLGWFVWLEESILFSFCRNFNSQIVKSSTLKHK